MSTSANSLASYGIRDVRAEGDEVVHAAERLELDGCTIVEDVIPPEELAAVRDALDGLLERAQQAAGGRERLATINEADIVRAPLAMDDRFLDLATMPRLLAVVGAMLGEYFIVSQQNGVINPPVGQHNHQSAYHRDIPYQHFTSSRPMAVNILLCIDPFDATTGGTFFLPGSHLHERFPTATYARRAERQIEARAGSAIVMNSMLYHRAGTNISPRRRRGLNTVYSLPFIKQQIVLPSLMGDRFVGDARMRRLLGYDCDPPGTVEQYLAGRFARA